MSGRRNASLAAAVLFISLASAGRAAVPCASWKEADKQLRVAWAKGYPNEKLLKLDPNGEPTSYDKLKSTNQEKIDEYGDKWEFLSKQTYCRVPAKALVQQGAGQVNFEVSAVFRKDGSKYVFDDIGVGDSQPVVQAGQEAPSRDDIKKMAAADWLQNNPKTKVEKVAISKPELKSDSEAGRWWYTTGVDVFITDEDGTKKKCTSDYGTVYKGERSKEGVDASGPWKFYFLDEPSCE